MIKKDKLFQWIRSAPLLLTLACTGAGQGWPSEAQAVDRAGGYQLEVTDPSGHSLPTFAHAGRTWVLGTQGQRYRIRVRNPSPYRVEAVISVDGRDVLDGKAALTSKPGYILPPWGDVTVEGFRLSMRDVATFRFASVPDSYAAQMGDDRNVGVIGVAIFRERQPDPPPVAQRREERWHDDADRQGGRAGPPAAPSAAKGAAAAPQDRAQSSEDRPGLGTAFGERREHRVVQVEFQRARPWQPDVLLSLRYNDAPGLMAAGVEIRPPRPMLPPNEVYRRYTAQPFVDRPTYAQPPPGWTGY